MARLGRIVFPGYPHHITQRGIRRFETFRHREDRLFFVKLLQKYVEQFSLEIWSYVLMTNHFHLIAVPKDKDSMAAAMKNTLSDYARAFNLKYGYQGHLWQARFYSSVMGPDHLFNAVRYVERNPVRAGLVTRAEEYEWSSAAYHCGLRTVDEIVAPGSPIVGAVQNWSEWLQVVDEPADQMLRRQTRIGWPTTASKEFLRMLESKLGRPMQPYKPTHVSKGNKLQEKE